MWFLVGFGFLTFGTPASSGSTATQTGQGTEEGTIIYYQNEFIETTAYLLVISILVYCNEYKNIPP